MGYTNYTPTYRFPQYVDTDKPTFTGDLNRFFQNLESALSDMQALINQQQTQIITLQNSLAILQNGSN